ncbi:breast cancer type 2 susceptibility protein isoform X2 [Phycodurus eques]|uniref:breast cancer type 2 susceptibility protein isoform X2 n=1 Tax=Phycodurus eques TaxID=693459 RepID=UPI002ACEFFD6|nr:breast cancer type 2 susceptibility protein isoform X2 [Phycodurus eques]
MYDHLTEELWKELGPVDRDWFQLLTTRAFSREGNVSDQEDQLCPNQEGKFKTPLGKTAAAAAESQQFSTPKVFRRAYGVSPDAKDQQQDLLNTPQKSPASYAQHISESLGANIHPDISWTSSLNTPPALPSTLILSKADESPCPVTFSVGKSVVLVRKLFPSLSNASCNGATSPQSNDPPVFLQDSDSPEADPHPASQRPPHGSLEHSDGIWRKQVLDTIEDEAIRSPVASVLDNAENSPDTFFTNRNSVLRKVKSDRMQRRQEERHSSSSDVSTESKPVSPEQGESDQELCRKHPVECGDTGLTQWSPLSLSDILATTVAPQVGDKSTSTQAKNECNSGQPVRPSLNTAGFTKKKTKFIYTIDKEKHSLKNNSKQGHELSVTLVPKTCDEAGGCNISDGKEELQQWEHIPREKLPPLLRANTQDLDMSQLCRAFAQDFSQMSHLGAPSKAAPPPPSPPPPSSFSPLACLTALKVARQKAKRQASVHREAPLDESVAEVVASDSGFLSASADFSHVTTSCLEKPNPSDQCTLESTSREQSKVCLEELSLGTATKDTSARLLCSPADLPCPPLLLQSSDCEKTQKNEAVYLLSKQLTGFKTASNRGIQISAANLQKAEHLFDETIGQQPIKVVCDKEISATLSSVVSRPVKVSRKCLWKDDENSSETDEGKPRSDSSIKQVQNAPKSPGNMSTGACQIDQHIRCDWYAKEEIPAIPSSAPSRLIRVSKKVSLSPKEDRLAFELYDTEESLQSVSSSIKRLQNGPKSPGNMNAVACQADQPIEYDLDAEVGNPAFAVAPLGQKLNQGNCQLTASEKADVKELCILLEEEDSQFEFTQFRTVKVKQLGQEGSTSSPTVGKDLDPDFLSSINFDDSFCTEANEKIVFTSNDKTNHEEPNVAKEPPLEPLKKEATISSRFQTAEAGVMRVSKKCLKKTKHLLHDLEWGTSAHKPSGEDCRRTLHESTSQKENNFKDSQGFLSSVKPVQSSPKSTGDMQAAMHQGGFQMASGKTILISPRAMQRGNAVFKNCIHENEHHLVGSKPLTNPALSSSASPTLVSSIDSYLSSSAGFRPAGGKGVPLSAEAMAQAKHLLQEEQVKCGTSLGIKHVDRRPSGFQTAGGKQVAVSVAALKKAKSLLDDCNEVEEHPSRYPPERKCEVLSDSEKPGSFSDKSFFDNLCSTLESPSVSGVKAFNAKRGNATNVEKDGSKYPVEKEEIQHSENHANPSLEVGSSSLGGGGFSTASGKKVCVSAAAMKKAKHLLQEDHEDDLSSEMKHKCFSGFERVDCRSGGFQTAGGKQLVVSSATLKKAKVLLNDCDAIEKQRACYPASRKSEFLSASRNPVSFSAKADLCSVSESPAAKTCGLKPANATNMEKMAEPNMNAGPFLENKNIHHHNLENHGTPSLERGSSSLSGGGFCTASGKKVMVSTAAMAKAKHLLQDDHEDDSTKHGSFLRVERINHRFLTAGGKRVAVSPAAVKDAANSLLDCDSVEEQPPLDAPARKSKFLSASEKPLSFLDNRVFDQVGPTSESLSVSGLKVKLNCLNYPMENENIQHHDKLENHLDFVASFPSGGGFSTASGKKVSVSAVAIEKAKQLLQEDRNDDLSTKMKHGCFSGVERVDRHIGGFQTAGGKQVAISSTALKKAKSLLDDYDSVEEHPSRYPLSKKSEFLASEMPANSLFDNLDSTSEGPAVNTNDANTASEETLDGSFLIAGETNRKTSVPNKATREADDYFQDRMDSNDGMPGKDKETRSEEVKINAFKFENVNGAPFADKNIGPHNNLENHGTRSLDVCCSSLSVGGGFCTARGKSVSVSDEAMTRAKSLFSDVESNNLKLLHNTSLQNTKRDDLQNVGFQTASGRRVSMSSAALAKAKSFFTECHEDTADVPYACTSSSGGFNTASGKKVLVSHNAIARAKSLLDESFTDKGVCFQSPAAHKKAKNVLRECEEQNDKTSVKPSKIMKCEFNAASGKPVSFSAEARRKAKALFDDISLNQGVQTGARKITFSVPSVSGLAQGQSAFLREKKPAAAEATTHEGGDLPGQEMSDELDGEIYKTPEEPAVVNFQSHDLTDCTETQQLFLAKEALDCTKALLADESLAGPAMTLDNTQPKNDSHGPAEEQTRGKRSAEGTELDDQPPLKRRLLDELDGSLDSRGGSRLCPQTSSPNGLMKDRPAFKYNVLLRPNITKPHRDGMDYVEASASPRTNQKPSKAGLISAPAFFKTTEACSRSGNTKTPPAFVPPFKRQRTAIEQRSTKHLNNDTKTTQNSEDPHTSTSDHRITSHVCSERPPADGCWSQGTTLENVELARDMQDMRIRKKKHQTIRPLPGSLFRAKTSGATRILLKDVVAGRPPAKYTQKQLYEYGVHRHVCKITSETAEAFRFPLELFFKKDVFADEGSIQLADGGRLIPSRDGTAGREQFFRALCDTPGVDPKLLSDKWVFNHYRWIVWKLASMERSFPETMGGLCLTPERVLLQLKYRYDVEVDHSRRPALKKVMEKDDTAAKALVLCVCGVVSRGQVGNPCAVVWLTDGWYAIKAQLDEPLSILLREGRLAVGGKLIVHGAQLAGSQDPCTPLEAPESLMLKIFANSSRPARWDAKLGFYKDPRPFLLPLASLYGNGGPVGCVDIVVLRSYPVQWMERKNDGGVVFRSARAEEKEAARYNSHMQKAMEFLYAKIQAEFEQEDKESKRQLARRTVSHRDIGGLQDGQELYEAVGDDLAGLEAHLSEQQLETLQAYRRSLLEKKQAEMQARYRRATEKNADDGQASCPQRNVTPVWRLCVADSLNPTGNIYQLSLWRPSSDLQALLKEGCRYKVYNLSTSDRKKRADAATLQLTATKKTQFQDLQTSPECLSSCFQPRVSTNFVDLQNLEFNRVCGEVDLTGCVVSVIDGQGASPAFYLVDCNVNFVKVRCFSSLLQAGLADVVKSGALLALSNLQLRGRSVRPTPVVYAGDLTVFSANPKEEHLQQALGQLRNLLREQENFFVHAEDKLSQVLKCNLWSSASSPNLPPQTPTSQHMRATTTPQQPIRSLGCFTPVSRNLHPPANAPCSLEKDPRSLKRKRAMDYLSRVPSPPPLFRLGPAASPSVKKTFNCPRRTSVLCTVKTVHNPTPTPLSGGPSEEEWVNDQELAMIDTQALRVNNAL